MLARDNPYLVCETNVVGTIHLMEAARQRKVGRFVFLSSASAFGTTPPAPVPDDAPLRPQDLYGATKGACDLLLQGYRLQYGLDAIALRISNAYGPGRRTRCAVRTHMRTEYEDYEEPEAKRHLVRIFLRDEGRPSYMG